MATTFSPKTRFCYFLQLPALAICQDLDGNKAKLYSFCENSLSDQFCSSLDD
jgi:hypothetical protein